MRMVSRERTERHLAGPPIEVIDTVMTRIEAVDDDLMIAFDFEAPWLSVVTARRPTRQIKKLLAGLAYR